MAKYKVHFFCNECSETHEVDIIIELGDGPANRESIGDAYAGKEIPPNTATLINNKFYCPKTKKLTIQKDNNQLFLVPIGD